MQSDGREALNTLLSDHVPEAFTDDERAVLDRFFSNTDSPVFVITGLSQAVIGALFARYSRTHKTLRRLFLDEFLGGETPEERDQIVRELAEQIRSGRYETVVLGGARADDLYERVVAQFGDDSVNQLGGAHLAIERCSNILTKQIEWGRLSGYLEQSTRYIEFDKPNTSGNYRFMVPGEVKAAGLEAYFTAKMNELFGIYSECVAGLQNYLKEKYPFHEEARKLKEKNGTELTESAYKTSIRTQACDIARALLPACTLSNTGWFGPGQQFEMAIHRMRAHPLKEVRDCAELALAELRTVIPEFLKRVDVEHKGWAQTNYLRDKEAALRERAQELLRETAPSDVPAVELVDWVPADEAEARIIAGALYRHAHLPKQQIVELLKGMSSDERLELLKLTVGSRENRRHKPGREFEDVAVEFDILADYGSFRDLQRHRILTIDWQELTTNYPFQQNEAWAESGLLELFLSGMALSQEVYRRLAEEINPTVAQYAVSFGYPLRYRMRFNIREAFHLLELRTSPQAHPSYKTICLEMVRQLNEVAGYDRITALKIYLGHETDSLTRLEAAAVTEQKLAQIAAKLREHSPEVI